MAVLKCTLESGRSNRLVYGTDNPKILIRNPDSWLETARYQQLFTFHLLLGHDEKLLGSGYDHNVRYPS